MTSTPSRHVRRQATAVAVSSHWSEFSRRAIIALLFTALVVTSLVSTAPVNAQRAAPYSFADLTEKLSPAVVNISTVQTIERRRRRLPGGLPFGDDFFNFDDRNNDDDEDNTLQTQSLGSGFIIDASGLVVTNNHVVEDADEITVSLSDGKEYPAELIGRDETTDLALLKIERDEPFPSVKWGDSDAERVGDWVLAIGNPFGLGGTVTAGIISARARAPGGASGEIDFLQTDASINKGNSGGPLFNLDGEVIGVNTAIFSPSGGSVGIGFAIQSKDAELIISELRDNGRVRRGWLGVTIQTFTENMAKSQGFEEGGGVLISGFADGISPARDSGFEIGDVIKTWNGQSVDNNRELQRAVARTRVGEEVQVEVLRDGKIVTLPVVVAEKPANLNAAGEEVEEDEDRPLNARLTIEGMDLLPLNDILRQRFRLDEDVEGILVARVKRNSNAYRAGIRQGMVILEANSAEVTAPADLESIIEAARDAGRPSVLLYVSVRGRAFFLPLELSDEE